jgi:hypothetical protein
LLELYPDHQQTVVAVLAPCIANQWKHHQDSFKKLCELFVGYHKTALAGSYNKNMPQHFSSFRSITKKRQQEADISELLGELHDAALHAAVGVWRDEFGKSFLGTLKSFLAEKFGVASDVIQPGKFAAHFAFDKLGLETSLMLSAPATPKSKQNDKIFKVAMDERQLQVKRSSSLKRLKVCYSSLAIEFAKFVFLNMDAAWADSLHIDFVARVWSHIRTSKRHAAWVGRVITPQPASPLIQPGFLTYDPKAQLMHCLWLPGRVGDVFVFESKQLGFVELSGSPIATDFWSNVTFLLFNESL